MFNSPRRQMEELENYRRKTNAISFIEGVALGGLVGLVAGLLLAPNAGDETMMLIGENTKHVLNKGKSKLTKGCCKTSDCCEEELDDLESEEIESEVIEATEEVPAEIAEEEK